MRYTLLILSLLLFSCGNTFYIVRHAEKETGIDPATMKPFTDPPLSFDGGKRALALKETLKGENIRYIFSTNTLRTISTAKPLDEYLLAVQTELYSPRKDSTDAFIEKLKSIKKGNVLVIGHSNTIDDLANKLCGATVVPGDLPDSDYDNLYKIKRKGNKYIFKGETYGVPTQ